MDAKYAAAIFTVFLVLANVGCAPLPDSAGIVPLMDGLAYGGIPYGSVSGQLAEYFGPHEAVTPKRKPDFDDYNLQHL